MNHQPLFARQRATTLFTTNILLLTALLVSSLLRKYFCRGMSMRPFEQPGLIRSPITGYAIGCLGSPLILLPLGVMLIYGLWNRPPSAVEIAVGVGLLVLYWVLGHLVDPGTMAERTSQQLSGWASRYQQAMARTHALPDFNQATWAMRHELNALLGRTVDDELAGSDGPIFPGDPRLSRDLHLAQFMHTMICLRILLLKLPSLSESIPKDDWATDAIHLLASTRAEESSFPHELEDFKEALARLAREHGPLDEVARRIETHLSNL